MFEQKIKDQCLVGTRRARTLARPAKISGIGLHTGGVVEMRFCPASEGQGICFKRVDLPGQPIIPARPQYVTDTRRSTTIGVEGAAVHTVEHVLAALRAYQIDNLMIEITDAEPPVAGGCSMPFVELIEEAGTLEQLQEIPISRLEQPVYLSQGETHLVALPADHYQISYTLHYPQSPAIGSQYFSIGVDSSSFRAELAPCRSFALYEEISGLLEAGLIRGTSLDSGVVIKGNATLSKDGLHFPDELVRHKVLDMVGDLSLIGFDLQAHIIAIRAGHAANAALAEKLLGSLIENE